MHVLSSHVSPRDWVTIHNTTKEICQPPKRPTLNVNSGSELGIFLLIKFLSFSAFFKAQLKEQLTSFQLKDHKSSRF